MTPVDQTICTVDRARGIYGDCLRACVASIFDLPLEEVPHFLHDGGGDSTSGEDWWWTRLFRWAAARGLEPVFTLDEPQGYSIAGGKSPRGPWGHWVVWQAGQCAHDPNPARGGLVGAPQDFLCFKPVQEQ